MPESSGSALKTQSQSTIVKLLIDKQNLDAQIFGYTVNRQVSTSW